MKVATNPVHIFGDKGYRRYMNVQIRPSARALPGDSRFRRKSSPPYQLQSPVITLLPVCGSRK